MNKLHVLLGAGLLTCSGALLAADHTRGDAVLASLDTNNDGVVNLIEFQSRENNMLARMDSDGNGVLTIDEVINGRYGMGRRGERSGDDTADRPEPTAEQLERMATMRAQMSERATKQFQDMDANGDDIVTLDEFQTANFNEMDRNDDGVLDADEMRPPRMGRPGPGGRGPGDRPRGERPARN